MTIQLLDQMAKDDVTVPQGRLIAFISTNNQCSSRHVADGLGIPVTSASKITLALVRKGLITNVKSAYDGRERVVSLTKKGAKVLERMEKAMQHG